MLRRYYATENSVETLIESLQNDADSSGSMQLHEAADSDVQRDPRLHAPASVQDTATNQDLHAAACSGAQQDEAAGSDTSKEVRTSDGLDDFLKEQRRVKDEQIKVKDQQIAAMLERDRETNILIR
ncbi:MAG: hypothetical protein ACR2PF_00790, partial [Rhizobiaceae bacterium]